MNFEINVQQRFLMKPDIGCEFASLCSSLDPFTDYLFGDDLQKQLTDVDENKIGVKVLKNGSKQNYPNTGTGQSNGSEYYYRAAYYKTKNCYSQGKATQQEIPKQFKGVIELPNQPDC